MARNPRFRISAKMTLDVFLFLLFLLCVQMFVLPLPTAHATCSGRCYGVVDWPNAILGAQTFIDTTSRGSPAGHHITDELWLIDKTTNCGGTGWSCWVEAGFGTRDDKSGIWYFWMDIRPGDNGHLNPHWVYQVPSGDYNQWFLYIIDQGDPGTNTFVISVFNASTGNQVWSGLSTNNRMHANDIEIGLETTDTLSSYEVNTYFRKNQYHGTNGVWNWQANPGQVTNQDPAVFTWDQPPNPSNNPPGGIGHTSCGC